MSSREQVIALRKNRLDLEHATIIQERGIFLATAVGYPVTALNLIISFRLDREPWFPLLVTFLAILWVPFYLWYDDRTRRVRAKQEEIDALISELEPGDSPNV